MPGNRSPRDEGAALHQAVWRLVDAVREGKLGDGTMVPFPFEGVTALVEYVSRRAAAYVREIGESECGFSSSDCDELAERIERMLHLNDASGHVEIPTTRPPPVLAEKPDDIVISVNLTPDDIGGAVTHELLRQYGHDPHKGVWRTCVNYDVEMRGPSPTLRGVRVTIEPGEKCAICERAARVDSKLCARCDLERLAAASRARISAGTGLTYSNSEEFSESNWIKRVTGGSP